MEFCYKVRQHDDPSTNAKVVCALSTVGDAMFRAEDDNSLKMHFFTEQFGIAGGSAASDRQSGIIMAD